MPVLLAIRKTRTRQLSNSSESDSDVVGAGLCVVSVAGDELYVFM